METASLFDIPEVRDRLYRWSVERYELLGEKGIQGINDELIGGLLLHRPPRPPLHTYLSHALYRHFNAQMPAGYLLGMYWPLRSDHSEPQPDLVIVRGGEEDFRGRHPTTAELVVEITTDDPRLNRALASLYAEAGVKEYWIVLANEKQVEVYRQPLNGIYQRKQFYSAAETLACESVPGLQAPLADWFA